MTSPLQPIADILTQSAGWKSTLPDAGGVFRFALEDGLDFELFSPENRTGILLAVLRTRREGEELLTDDEARRLGALAAGSLKKRRSVLSVGERGIELYRTFPIAGTSGEIVPEVRDFLNDLAWWKRQLSGPGQTSGASSPFPSFSTGWFDTRLFQG